jgi:hypothetical protein
MACSEPIYYLLHREAPDGSEGLLMEPDLASALADAADPAWRPVRITFGRAGTHRRRRHQGRP